MARQERFTVNLPLGIGMRELDATRLNDVIRNKAEAHGYDQKLGKDLCVKYRVRIPGTDDKPGYKYFDTEAERLEAIEKASDRMIARWYAGEWNLDGSGRGIDANEARKFAVLFGLLKVAPKEQGARRKAGLPALYTAWALVKAGKVLKGKALDDACAWAIADVDKRCAIIASAFE